MEFVKNRFSVLWFYGRSVLEIYRIYIGVTKREKEGAYFLGNSLILEYPLIKKEFNKHLIFNNLNITRNEKIEYNSAK
jgi:hypothetical protein